MSQKAITIYTPSSAAPHIYAEDDAQVHRALINGSGISFADGMLACTIVNDNTVRLASGLYSMQGYLISVPNGTVEELSINSGTAGSYRHDLIVADFERGGGNTADTFTIHVIQGEVATSAGAADDPTLANDDLTIGGSHRQEALYRIVISGTTISEVVRVAPYIGNVYQ